MATYYINADTGNDSTGDGSIGSPWLLLSYAHGQATTGDTIICQDSAASYTFVNQSFTKNLTIQGEQNDASGAVFDALTGNVIWTISTADTTVNISKITMQNGYSSGNGLFTLGSNAKSSIFNIDLVKVLNWRLNGQTSVSGDYALFFSRAGFTAGLEGEFNVTNSIFDIY